MAKRRGPKPDKSVHRYVVKLTLRDGNPDHAKVRKLLDDAPHKGELVIQALLGRIDIVPDDEADDDDFGDGWGDAIM